MNPIGASRFAATPRLGSRASAAAPRITDDADPELDIGTSRVPSINGSYINTAGQDVSYHQPLLFCALCLLVAITFFDLTTIVHASEL